MQSASAGTTAEAERRANGGIESGGPGRSRSDSGQDRAVAHCRSMPWVEERWGVRYSETGMLRVLWSLDLSRRKTRPRHPQSSEKAQQAFKKDPMGDGRSSFSRVRRPTEVGGERTTPALHIEDAIEHLVGYLREEITEKSPRLPVISGRVAGHDPRSWRWSNPRDIRLESF
jgi:hypothetical protein